MAAESRHERPVRRGKVDDTGGDVEGGQKLYYHLTLLAETVEGYRNLLKLSSAAYLEGYYYKPRVDWELLERHHDGLIATTGCLGGVVLQALLGGRRRRGRAPGGPAAGHLRQGQPLRRAPGPRHRRPAPHQPPADRDRPPPRCAAAGHQRQPLHPPRGRGRPRRAALRADRSPALGHQPLQLRGHRALPEVGGARCATCSASVPEACDNTLLIAERADVQIELGKPSLPEFPVPEHFSGETYEERALAYLRDLTIEGARERYGDSLPAEVVERLDYELGVIGNMGFAAYFLVVWDLIRFARESGIRVGPGRGSAAGCCVAYCLRIVDLDPDPLRPALRALPEPGPQADARHRHGLRRALPRRRHALRGGEVRQRPGGPGHHLLDDQGPGRRARRRPGARQALHRRRPDRQGHAASGHGPRHPPARLPDQDRGARGGLRRRRRAAGHARRRTPTPRRSSMSRSGSRACGARTASTPPRW